MEMKCLVCKEDFKEKSKKFTIIRKNLFVTHINCKVTDFQWNVLNIIIYWNGVWHRYDNLAEELKEQYQIEASRKEMKEALQFLVKTGEVKFCPLVNSDCVPNGSGYVWKHGRAVV